VRVEALLGGGAGEDFHVVATAAAVEEGLAQAEVLVEDEVGLGVGVDSAGEGEEAIELLIYRSDGMRFDLRARRLLGSDSVVK
jgi:hypothetical protein